MMRERFDGLLPWYVNNTLEAAEREWLDDYLRAHPEASSELRWHVSLQAKVQENAPEVPPEIGLERLLKRIRQEKSPASATFAERLGEFFAGFRLTPALAACAIIAVQAAVIATLLFDETEPDYAAVRSLGSDPEQGPVLRVNFKPDATESEIRLLLIAVGGTLVGGPGQLGDYFLKVPAERISPASDELKASSIVEAVAVTTSSRKNE